MRDRPRGAAVEDADAALDQLLFVLSVMPVSRSGRGQGTRYTPGAAGTATSTRSAKGAKPVNPAASRPPRDQSTKSILCCPVPAPASRGSACRATPRRQTRSLRRIELVQMYSPRSCADITRERSSGYSKWRRAYAAVSPWRPRRSTLSSTPQPTALGVAGRVIWAVGKKAKSVERPSPLLSPKY
jgi:hypothetical protein